MSTEPEYNYNEPIVTESVETPGSSLHLPFALLTSALAVVMIAQVSGVFFNRSNLREGISQLVQGKTQLVEAGRAREPIVKQSSELQAKLQALVLDLLLLSKTDEDAKTIVTKYNIQQQTPPNGSEAPAATPAP